MFDYMSNTSEKWVAFMKLADQASLSREAQGQQSVPLPELGELAKQQEVMWQASIYIILYAIVLQIKLNTFYTCYGTLMTIHYVFS